MSIGSQRALPGFIRFPRVSQPAPAVLRVVLLACGIAATLLYMGLDALAAVLHDGYSYTGQTISELSAVGASTRSLWLPVAIVYSILVIAFACGIWLAAGRRSRLRVIAVLVAVLGLLGLVAWPFAPMHPREVLAAGGGTWQDTLHLALGAVDSFLFMACIALGAGQGGSRFRLYSLATLAAVLVCGALTAMEAGSVSDNEETPWVGVTERIAVFGSMVWLAVLATLLLAHERLAPSRVARQRGD